MEKKKIINIIIVICAILSIIGGTFAWLNYRTNETALVLTVGEVNGMLVTVKPYKLNGTLPLTNNLNEAKVIEVTAENKKSSTEKMQLYFDISSMDSVLNSSTYFNYKITKSTDGTNYTDVSNGNFTTANTTDDFVVLTENIPNNTNNPYYYKVYIWLNKDNTDQSALQNKTFTAEFRANIQSLPTLYSAVANHEIKTSPTSWGAIPTAEEAGVYKTTQDGTDIYYYRGDVNDNNVLYDNKCWKIVRTTTTGGVKMIYNGLPTTEGTVTRCGTDVTTSQTDGSSNVKLDGTNTTYKFDSTSPYSPDYRESTIKPLIDSWFTSNVDDSMLETTDFCIDLEVSSVSGSTTYYKPRERWNAKSSTGAPTLDCTGTNKYPNTGYVGLLTMDEVWLAGGIATNNTYYLYTNTSWWLLSPSNVSSSSANVFDVYSDGYIYFSVTGTLDVRPVVSVASDIKYTGTGLYNDPYVPIS